MAYFQSGGIYKIINAKAGNCIDLSAGDNESLIGFEYHGGDNQKVRTLSSSASPPVALTLACIVAFREAARRPRLGHPERRHWQVPLHH